MKLTGVSLSPYYERAMLVLDIKNAHDRVEKVGLPGAFGSAEMKAANVTGKIPFLTLADGTTLPEGQVIAEYLDSVLDGPALMPSAALEAAKAKLLCRIVDIYIAPGGAPLARTVTRGTFDDAAIEKSLTEILPEGLDMIEHHLSGGPYAVGEAVSFGDLALIPHMFHFLEFLGHFEIDPLNGRPKLTAWWDHWRESDTVTTCHARMRSSMEKVKAMRAASRG